MRARLVIIFAFEKSRAEKKKFASRISEAFTSPLENASEIFLPRDFLFTASIFEFVGSHCRTLYTYPIVSKTSAQINFEEAYLRIMGNVDHMWC